MFGFFGPSKARYQVVGYTKGGEAFTELLPCHDKEVPLIASEFYEGVSITSREDLRLTQTEYLEEYFKRVTKRDQEYGVLVRWDKPVDRIITGVTLDYYRDKELTDGLELYTYDNLDCLKVLLKSEQPELKI